MINFDPVKHEYTNKGVVYDSVTRVISKYQNPFDASYWSTYKGLKEVIIEKQGERAWIALKKQAGGWGRTVDFYRKDYFKLAKATKEAVERRAAEYRDSWDIKGHNARVTGTAVHSWKERELKSKKHISSSVSGTTVTLSVSSGQLLREQSFDSDKVYPELIISNDQYKIAGMADRVEKHGPNVYIQDYKTSEEIQKTAFADATMKFPLDCFPDCNFYHYTIQLSTYGWMLEQVGFRVKGCTIYKLVPPDYDERTMRSYPLDYRPDLVEMMLKHHRGVEVKRGPVAVAPRQYSKDTFNFG